MSKHDSYATLVIAIISYSNLASQGLLCLRVARDWKFAHYCVTCENYHFLLKNGNNFQSFVKVPLSSFRTSLQEIYSIAFLNLSIFVLVIIL